MDQSFLCWSSGSQAQRLSPGHADEKIEVSHETYAFLSLLTSSSASVGLAGACFFWRQLVDLGIVLISSSLCGRGQGQSPEESTVPTNGEEDDVGTVGSCIPVTVESQVPYRATVNRKKLHLQQQRQHHGHQESIRKEEIKRRMDSWPWHSSMMQAEIRLITNGRP